MNGEGMSKEGQGVVGKKCGSMKLRVVNNVRKINKKMELVRYG